MGSVIFFLYKLETSRQQPTDVDWAYYVAISSETGNEAVSVVVTDEQGKKVIREIMWGRP